MNILQALLSTQNPHEFVSQLNLEQLNQLHDEIAFSQNNLNMVSVEMLQLLAQRYDQVSMQEVQQIVTENGTINSAEVAVSSNVQLSDFEKKFLEPNHNQNHEQVLLFNK